MNRKYFYVIAIIAACSLLLILFSLWKDASTTFPAENIPPQPRAPYKTYISGVGVVEASSDNIYIGTPVNRIVDKVLVKVGTKVKKGDVLLWLEDRDLQSELKARQVAYENALAKLKKLESLPRAEDVQAAEAALQVTQTQLDLSKKQYEMVLELDDPRALSQEEINRRKYNYQQAQAKWEEAKADLDKIKAGAWQPDIEIAKLEIQQAKANVDLIKTDIERNIIRSPIDGTVLQIKIHEGEFPPPDTSRIPIMIVGNTDQLHLRVSINQFDARYFRANAPAVAFSEGDATIELPLEFLSIEPLLVSKQDLTSDMTEKVDTRVLQVIYRIKKNDQRLFVGQQMDVFVETDNASHEIAK